MDRIKEAARECAREAWAMGDPDLPELMPTTPLEGDWDCLKEVCNRKPTDEEMRTFAEAYAEEMRAFAEAYAEAMAAVE